MSRKDRFLAYANFYIVLHFLSHENHSHFTHSPHNSHKHSSQET